MHRTSLLFCVFMFVAIAVARNPKDKYGILYVNEITANIDTFTVKIEESFVEDNILRIDIIEEWNGDGVRAEGIFFNDGDVVLADYFLVNPNTTFPGELYANGGIYADAGRVGDPGVVGGQEDDFPEDFYSFSVADDTGLTTFRGVLFVDEGIFVNGDAFTVAAGTGETTVRDTDLNANGGINVNDGAFAASQTGDVFIGSSLHVLQTVVLGTTNAEDRFIRRDPTPAQLGGDTIFSAQDGTAAGGNLIILPGIETSCTEVGDETCSDGSIFVGSIENGNVRIKRPDVNGDGARTTYQGQNSPNGDGGDLLFAPGDSTADGNGGDLIVIPGLSANGNHGHIYFGSDEAGLENDITIQRPIALRGNGGDTIFAGQNTQNGNAGNLNILAGQGAIGGSLSLIPGDANQDVTLEEQGDIVLGNPDSNDLRIVRSESVNADAGNTIWEGQTSNDQDGGALYLKAGDSKGNGNGGSIHLLPGSNPGDRESFGVAAGQIFVGDLVADLTITREPRNGGGLDTLIFGQSGAATQGGDLFLRGGEGTSVGGDINVRGGNVNVDDVLPNSNAFDVGGGAFLISGNGQISGGSVNIYGGTGTGVGNGGAISISTGSSIASGNIFLNAGSGASLGDIAIGDQSNNFILEDTPLVIQDSYFTITDRAEEIFLRADPQSILEYNGKTLLRSVSDYPVPAVDTTAILDDADNELTETAYRLAQLQNSLEILVNALGQCQHGLFLTTDQFGRPDSCPEFTV